MTLDILDVRLPTHVTFGFEEFSIPLLFIAMDWLLTQVVKHGYTAEMPKVSGEAHH